MLKKIKVFVEAEIVVDQRLYGDMSNDEIADVEGKQWQEWILDHIISDKITVTDVKSEVVDG